VTRRVVQLVERRTREVRLPRRAAEFLRDHAANLIGVEPAFEPGRYRLTSRGFVGFLAGPSVRFEIRPKLPWPHLLMLLGLPAGIAAPGERIPTPTDLLNVLALGLADRLRTVVRAGLVRGYHEAEAVSPFLRGRLRTSDQMRDAAARAFPDQFHITDTAFGLDTPWNRIPKAVATGLLSCPELSESVRAELATAIQPFESVPVAPVTDADFDAAAREPRAAGYADLLAVCRLLHDGLTAATLPATGTGGFLLDLGRAFEGYLARTVSEAFASRPGWSVEPQPRFDLGVIGGERVILQPDLLIRRRGAVQAVLDAKWKRPGLEAADLHQILAYSAVTGCTRVGLVYPGRRSGRRDLLINGRVRLSLYRLRVVGPAADCRAAAFRLARAACRV
jgi:5-methylcytosine-specific restriction enzyme subunit McrC